MIPADELGAAWRLAQELWETKVDLSPPAAAPPRDGQPLAWIDLATRQIQVDTAALGRMDCLGSLPAVLAHELGHHLRFPHTLRVVASLTRLALRLVPLPPEQAPMWLNLFFDLQVNEVVGRTRAEELAAVYRGFVAHPPAPSRKGKKPARPEPPSPLFAFYLAIYEELWALPPDSLMTAGRTAELERFFPGFRGEARLFAQTFWSLPTTHLQFVYFCAIFIRYLPEDRRSWEKVPLTGDLPSPGADDLDAVLRGDAAADAALDEAERRGWIRPETTIPEPEDGLAKLDRLLSGIPGKQAAASYRQALVERHYRRLVERHLVPLPEERRPVDTYLPTVTEDWEPGDELASIDWTASVLERGPLAAAQPRRREREPDEPSPDPTAVPSLEVWLDTSGSMPPPDRAENAMTLAALVLATATIRRSGRVKGIVWSSGEPLISPWLYGEDAARRFLLRTIGAGTEFPFERLEAHVAALPDALRVVISDGDFLHNCRPEAARASLARAAERSRRLVALLHVPSFSDAQVHQALGRATKLPTFAFARVDDLSQLAAMAATLAEALLGGRR